MKNIIMLGLVATMLVACGKKEEAAAPAVVEAPAAEAAPAASAPAVTENAEKAPAK